MASRDTSDQWVLTEGSEPGIPIGDPFGDDSVRSISIELLEADLESLDDAREQEPSSDERVSSEPPPMEALDALHELELMASSATDASRKAMLLETIAERRDELGQPHSAARTYQRLLELDPGHGRAFEHCAQYLEGAGRFEELVDVLLRRVEATTGRERVGLLRRAAHLLEHELHDVAQAVEALTLAWCLDPADAETGSELARLSSDTGSYADLIDAAQAELSRAPDGVRRLAIYRHCAHWHAALGQHEQARAYVEAALAEKPSDIEALEARVEILRAEGSFQALAEALTHLAHAQSTPRAEAQQYLAVGEVYEIHLSAPDQAAAAYLAALESVPQHEDALRRLDALYRERLSPDEDGPDDVEPLRALADFHQRSGDHRAAVPVLERLASLVRGTPNRIELRLAIARILEERLDDRCGALAQYAEVLDLAPMHREADAAIRRIHAEAGDWAATARCIEAAAGREEGGKARAKLLVELAGLYEERLGDPARALGAYARAVEADPQCHEAALEVASLHAAAGRHEEVYELLAPLSKNLHGCAVGLKRQIRHRLGEAAFRTGRDEEAISALTPGVGDEAPASVAMLLVSACFRAKRFQLLVERGRAVVAKHGEDLEARQMAELHHMLGVAQRELGDVGAAARAFRRVLSVDAGHGPSLDALVDLESMRGRWEVVAELMESIAEHTADDEERVRVLERLGDLCRERLVQLPRAVAVYRAALRRRPDDHRVLHKLLDTHRQAGAWREAVEVLDRIAAIESRPEARSKILYTAAIILRDELRDVEASLSKLDEALDTDPANLKTFAAIDTMLTEARAFDRLERAYRKALKRVVGNGEVALERQLWHNLGLIYRDRLGDFPRAVDAFRMATRLAPDDRVGHRILGELFTRTDHRFADCIADQQALLDEDPERLGAYHALFELYARAGDALRARSAAAALVFLGEADAAERDYVAGCRPAVLAPQRTVRGEHWARLRHPDLDPRVTFLFESFAEPLRKLRARRDADLGLDAHDQVDPGSSTRRIAGLFGGVTRYFRLPIAPRLFITPERPGGLQHVAGSRPAASLCGSGPLAGFDAAQLEFLVAHHLADYQPDLSIRTVLARPSELATVLRTGMHIAGHLQTGDGVAEHAERIGPRIEGRRMPGVVQACGAMAGRDLDRIALRWLAAAELTACRAGFVVCRDLAAAASVLSDLPMDAAGLGARKRSRDLVRFSVSEAYFELAASLMA